MIGSYVLSRTFVPIPTPPCHSITYISAHTIVHIFVLTPMPLYQYHAYISAHTIIHTVCRHTMPCPTLYIPLHSDLGSDFSESFGLALMRDVSISGLSESLRTSSHNAVVSGRHRGCAERQTLSARALTIESATSPAYLDERNTESTWYSRYGRPISVDRRRERGTRVCTRERKRERK